MIIYNIAWDVDAEDGLSILDEMTAEDAAEALGVPKSTYSNMHTDEWYDYAIEAWKKSPSTLHELIGLPSFVIAPAEIAEDPEYKSSEPGRYDQMCEHIADWLSDEYNFCVGSFALDTDFEPEFEPDEECVDIWMDDLKAKIEAGETTVMDEIDDVLGTISNEKIWKAGSDTKEQEDMHEQNITDLFEYLKNIQKYMKRR